MSSSGARIAQACLSPADASTSKYSKSSRSPLSVEISSHWNCSGRLSCELHNHSSTACPQDSERCRQGAYCVHSLKDARRLARYENKTQTPAVSPVKLSTCLGGWLAQLFNASGSKEDRADQGEVTPESQPGGFESFLLEYKAEKGLDPLQTYIMQPFKGADYSPFSSRDSDEQRISAVALAEVAITDMVSAIPSVDALRNVPYFDMLHNNLTQASEIPQSLTQEDVRPPNGTLKITCRDSEQLVTPDQFGSPDALASWLSDRLPFGISHWGSAPGSKRVANLWIELKEGEIVLENTSPLRRTVQVASVKIKNKAGHMLVEAHQEMADGSIRFRNRPLSEKMRPGENVEEACLRGIFEELGSQLGAKNRVRIDSGSYLAKQEERESLSYPGLLTSYVIHSVDAIVEDLPDTGFYTVEDEHNVLEDGLQSHKGAGCPCNGAATGVKKHFWRWITQPV